MSFANKRIKYSGNGRKSNSINLILISKHRFEAEVEYNESVLNVMKKMKSRQYDPCKRRWNFDLSDYYCLIGELRKLEFTVTGFPPVCMKIFKNQLNGKNNNNTNDITDEEFMNVDVKIRQALFPFQRDGVRFMISRNGRCLLADDMGLGKTVQSLGVASYFRNDWPLLIICPNSVKMSWYDQIYKWISEPVEVIVIKTSKDVEKKDALKNLTKDNIILVNYDIISKIGPKFQQLNFKTVIMDESHFIKSPSTSRTKACVPIAKLAYHSLLLSGTPALSRPQEMFTQIDCVAPNLYNGYFKEYGNRYCDPQTNKWGTSYTGSSNMTELQVILQEKIMLRRLKSEVLQQLPEKRREVMILAPEYLKKASLKRHAAIMMDEKLKGMERRGALLEYYHATGKVKVDAIKNYLDDLLESSQKFLFFAHHTEVLDAVEDQMKSKKVGYIRIDGSINSDLKQERVRKFQESTEEEIQVALLSIVAAGTGLNLTAASLAVFGELFWNPGILLQAENRCHRIGQRDFVTIHYLVAEQTADDYIWPLIENKLEMLTKAGLNEVTFKNCHTQRLEASFTEEDQVILDFFEQDFLEENEDLFVLSDEKQIPIKDQNETNEKLVSVPCKSNENVKESKNNQYLYNESSEISKNNLNEVKVDQKKLISNNQNKENLIIKDDNGMFDDDLDDINWSFDEFDDEGEVKKKNDDDDDINISMDSLCKLEPACKKRYVND